MSHIHSMVYWIVGYASCFIIASYRVANNAVCGGIYYFLFYVYQGGAPTLRCWNMSTTQSLLKNNKQSIRYSIHRSTRGDSTLKFT